MGFICKCPENRIQPRVLAEWTGLEPATPGVTGRYSNQLNYHSLCESSVPLVGAERFELPTFAL